MLKRFLPILIFVVLIIGCSDNTNSNKDMRQQEINLSENAAKAYAMACQQAEKDDSLGFLKLYEIAKDDDTYTVEYSEVAHEEILYLLYSKTNLWVKTFAQINQSEFFAYLNQSGVGVSTLPKGIKSEEEVYENILENLNKIDGNKTEMELIAFIKQKLKIILEP